MRCIRKSACMPSCELIHQQHRAHYSPTLGLDEIRTCQSAVPMGISVHSFSQTQLSLWHGTLTGIYIPLSCGNAVQDCEAKFPGKLCLVFQHPFTLLIRGVRKRFNCRAFPPLATRVNKFHPLSRKVLSSSITVYSFFITTKLSYPVEEMLCLTAHASLEFILRTHALPHLT